MNVSGIALEGIERSERLLEESAGKIARSLLAPEPPPGDAVSLSEEMVRLLRIKHSYQANVRVLQTGEEMQGRLLDDLG